MKKETKIKKIIAKTSVCLATFKEAFDKAESAADKLSQALNQFGENIEWNTQKFIRNGANILFIETGKTKNYGSVNIAKKASFKLQMQKDGGLGRGSLAIV